MPRGLSLVGEWEIQTNHFDECQTCPFAPTCIKQREFRACPFGDERFHSTRSRGKNTILNSLLDGIADALGGISGLSLDVLYVSAGTGTAATVASQTQLGTEVARTVVDTPSRPSTGKTTWYAFFGSSIPNGTYTEWALIAGTATSTLGTGTAVNRWLTTKTKGTTDTISVQYSITVAEA